MREPYSLRMSPESLRELMHAQPFIPFVLHTADGRNFDVPHPDFIAVTRNGRVARISTGEFNGEGFESLDVMLLVSASSREALGEPPVSENGENGAAR